MAELLDLAQSLAATASSGEQVEVFAGRTRNTSVRVYERTVESFTSAESAGVGFRVIVDGRQGFASAGTLDQVVLKETLEEARDNAAFTQRDEFLALAEPDGALRARLDLFRPSDLSADDKIARALELERLTEAGDRRVRVRNAIWSDTSIEQAIVTTTGIASWDRASFVQTSVSVIADQDGQTQTAGGFSAGRHPDDIDLSRAADEAVDHSIRMLGATKPASDKLVAVFMPQVTTQILRVVGQMLSGDALVKARTPFGDRVGEEIAAAIVTLVDDPTDTSSTTAWPDDDEGLASRRTALIDAGVLKTFLHDTYTARRTGGTSTGSAVRTYATTPSASARALCLQPGTRSQESIIAAIPRGVLVQSVTGMHSGVSSVSGDFSVGASGLMIRDGALAEPVQEMTLGTTVQRLLLDVVDVGADLRWFGDFAGVSLAVQDVSLGGR